MDLTEKSVIEKKKLIEIELPDIPKKIASIEKPDKKDIVSSHPEVFCKKVFLEISQNSQENKCARGSFLIMLQAYFYRTPLVAASVKSRDDV